MSTKLDEKKEETIKLIQKMNNYDVCKIKIFIAGMEAMKKIERK